MNDFNPLFFSDMTSAQLYSNDEPNQTNFQDMFVSLDPLLDPHISKGPAPEGSASPDALKTPTGSPPTAPQKMDCDIQSNNDTSQKVLVASPLDHSHDPTVPTATESKTHNGISTGKLRAHFMLDMPHHEYIFPTRGTINATMVEILVLLPHWFRNPQILMRFLNNGLMSNIHITIMEEYRKLELNTGEEIERARDYIADSYRKAMRKIVPSWLRRNHKAPEDWDATVMSIENVIPEAATKIGYVAPASIPFKDLAVGLKKLPQGYDAGDLTRALDYAMQNGKPGKDGTTTEFMFPDDIHIILNHIGRTEITVTHLDTHAVPRYATMVRATEQARRKKIADGRMQRQSKVESIQKPMDVPQSPQQPGSSQQAQMPPPPETMSTHFQLQQTHSTTMTFSNVQTNLPYRGMGITQMPTPPYPQQNLANLGIHTFNNPYNPIPQQTHPLFRSSSQQAAASVVSELLASRVYTQQQQQQQPTVGFPNIPNICQYQGEEDKAQYDFEQVLHYPGHWTQEEQMQVLMEANRTVRGELFTKVERWMDQTDEEGGGSSVEMQDRVGNAGEVGGASVELQD